MFLNINKFLTFEIPFFKNLFYSLNIDNKIEIDQKILKLKKFKL